MRKNETVQQDFYYMIRRIGSTTYKVKVVFHEEDGGETMEEKIMRMVRNASNTTDGKCGILEARHMSRQSERGA